MATDESASAAAEVPFCLRPAEPRDLAGIVELIRGLAEYERLTHLLEVTPEKLQPHLFGPRPAAEVLVAELRDEDDAAAGTAGPELAAFALYFTSFSTFLARPGLYLEDLYVRP